MTYKEARVYLDEMSKYGSVLGLDTIRGLLHELGDPQDDLKFIHIAGTNGKGSVLAYTSTILSEAGYRTGRYVSPTVMSYLEKIQVDGTWISELDFAQSVEKIKEAIASLKAKGEPLPTLFEAETAMAFLYFRKMHCDMVVLETGLGGETDATNIVKNTICAAFATIRRRSSWCDWRYAGGDCPDEVGHYQTWLCGSIRETDRRCEKCPEEKSRREELLLCRGGAKENENSDGQLRWNHIFL